MSERTAWGRWDCSRCGKVDISGKYKRCPACGDPREQAELDAMRPPTASDLAAPILDAEELALARSGADWICGFCGGTNQGRGPDAPPLDPTAPLICGSCGASSGDATGHGKTGPVLPEAPADPGGSWWRRATRKSRALAIVGVLGLTGFAFAYWATRTSEHVGHVTSLTYVHITQLQRWSDVTRGQWGRPAERLEVRPVGAKGETAGVQVTSCSQRHHSNESYACGTETYTDSESYTCGTTQSCSMVNNGNGSFTEKCSSSPKTCTRPVTRTRTKMCTRPVYREWCDYRTQEWSVVESRTAEGQGHDLRWETLHAMGDLERIAHVNTYTVVSGLDDDPAAHTQTVPREAYDKYAVGDAMIFTLQTVGGVQGVRRADGGP